MKDLLLIFALAVICFPWKIDGGPVFRSNLPTVYYQQLHSLATYANSNAYLYKGKNSDINIYYAKSVTEPVALPSYTKIFKVPYIQQKLLVQPSISYSGHKLVAPAQVEGVKLLVSPPSLPLHIENETRISSPELIDPFNRFTVPRISHSLPVLQQLQLVKATDSKPKENGVFLERIQVPQTNSDAENVNNSHIAPEVIDNTDANKGKTEAERDFNNFFNFDTTPFTPKEDVKLSEPEFGFIPPSTTTTRTTSNDDFKFIDRDFDFAPTPSTTTAKVDLEDLKLLEEFISSTTPASTSTAEHFQPPEDVDFTIPTDKNTSTGKTDDLRLPPPGRDREPDLLDLLDAINKADDRHRAEDENKFMSQQPNPKPEMQDRQDSSFERPSPFSPPSFNQPQPQVPQQQFPFQQNNRFRQPAQQGNQQTFPQLPLPAPPQTQTSDFFPNRFSPQRPSQENNDQQQSRPSIPGLPPPPQFQTDMFFPGNKLFNNRFQPPDNNQQQPLPNQPEQRQPFPFPGFPGGGPGAGGAQEPENGYNPYHMFDQFPEPPYESEFANIPERDAPEEQSARSAGESVPKPTLDFAQSTLRGVKTEEILEVVQRKQVPPECAYNTISYGPNGEDCVQMTKK